MTVQPRVLIVEDDALTALMLQNLLRDMGCDVCGLASTAPRGVALADHLRPDLVLLDLRLGKGTDGVAAAREIAHDLRLPVLVVSGTEPAEVADEGIGDMPWIHKPFMPHQVMSTVRRLLEDMRPKTAEPAAVPAIAPPRRITTRRYLTAAVA